MNAKKEEIGSLKEAIEEMELKNQAHEELLIRLYGKPRKPQKPSRLSSILSLADIIYTKYGVSADEAIKRAISSINSKTKI